MSVAVSRPRLARASGLALVLAVHAAVLYGLWQHQLAPRPQEAMTLFVNFIAPPIPEKKVEPLPMPEKSVPVPDPKPPVAVATAPVVAPSVEVTPSPPPEPAPAIETRAVPDIPAEPATPVVQAMPAAPPPAPPMPVTQHAAASGPVALPGELSVVCPQRTQPLYPILSRRMNEEGTVVLRVELDETGAVVAAQVKSSSGYPRLDEAALAAVRHWRCQPAMRQGQPVRSVALQPFKFVLQGS